MLARGFNAAGASENIVRAHSLPAITMKSISREVISYSVDALNDAAAESSGIITERAPRRRALS